MMFSWSLTAIGEKCMIFGELFFTNLFFELLKSISEEHN